MTEEVAAKCAVIHALDILGRKWIPWILCELIAHKQLFFSDLLHNVVGSSGSNISARVLSEALSRLEKEELVERIVDSSSMPIRVSYLLTAKGNDIGVVLSLLKGWGIKWGNITQKKCKSFTCVHNTIPMIDIDKAKKLQEKLGAEEIA
ncbi:MAG: winged helix-turn-helix transcriptional regulator [Candidatus Thorarchaeota archaeon]